MPPQSNPGLDPNVQAALQRRGLSAGGTGALTQTSPGAAMANPQPAPMDPAAMSQASAPTGTPAPTTPPKFEPQDRTDLITVALIEQMKNDNKLVKEQTKQAQASPQPAPAPAPAPAMPPMGGGKPTAPTWTGGWSQPMATSQMQGGYGMGKDFTGMNNYGQPGRI